MSELLPDADFEKQKNATLRVLNVIKSLEAELLAYEAVTLGFFETKRDKLTPEEERETFQTALKIAKMTVVQRVIADKYDAVLEQVRRQADRAGLENAMSGWLLKWKPAGKAD